VAPLNVDQLRLDQPVTLRFSGLNQRTTPEVRGRVTRISADTTVDSRSGISFYTVRVAVPKEQTERLGVITLVSGMPVEAFIETESRNVLSYFLKPFSDQVARAFRER
jgi:HlyD family secretion protein